MTSVWSLIPRCLLAVAEPVAKTQGVLEETEQGGLVAKLLESNLLNIAIILILLFILGRRVIGEALAKRREAILEELHQAEQRKQQAIEQLAEQQQKLAQAQQEAERIRQQAEAAAEARRQDLLQQLEQEIQRLRAAADKDLSTEQERLAQELRLYLVQQALSKVEQELPQYLTEQVQQRLIDQGIQLIAR